MKLYIREKVFAWNDAFDIFDEDGKKAYKCLGEEELFGNHFEIRKDGKTVADIHEKLIKLRPKYTVEIGDEEFEVIKRALGIRDNFIVKGLDWDISGDFMDHKYDITSGKKTIARIRKKILRAMKSYELDIQSEKDAVEVICCAVVIDAILSEENKEKKEKAK